LVDVIDKHRVTSLGNGHYQRKRLSLCREELLALLRQRLVTRVTKKIDAAALDERVERIADRRTDPYSEADAIARKLGF
jgi:putative protein kinase ArgK-like GTPase of G3E family